MIDTVNKNVILPVDENLLGCAIKKWGNTAQLFVAVEECAEFIQAGMKFENRGEPIDNLLEETADVLFLMLQMRMILGDNLVDSKMLKIQDKVRKMWGLFLQWWL